MERLLEVCECLAKNAEILGLTETQINKILLKHMKIDVVRNHAKDSTIGEEKPKDEPKRRNEMFSDFSF